MKKYIEVITLARQKPVKLYPTISKVQDSFD